MAGPCPPHAGSVRLSGCSDRAGSRRQAACEQGWGALFSLEWVGEAASPNWGACPPPLHRWTSRLQQSAPGAAAGPSRSKPWPWGRLPRHPLPSSQHLWRLRARTQAWGPLSGPCGRPRHGLGLPCPACLLPGSAWVPVARRGGGVWNPQALSRLPLSLPSEGPLGSSRVALHVPVLYPATHGTDRGAPPRGPA